jgi:PKD repeat protein
MTAALVAGTLGGVLASPVAAANPTTTLNFSGHATVQTTPTYGAICDDCAPDALFNGDNVGLGVRFQISANATWNPTATVSYQYSPSLLRQGQTLDLTDSLSGGSGPLSVTYALAGDFGIYYNSTFPADASIWNGGSDLQTFNFSTTGNGTCTLKLDGDGNYDCQTVDTITIVHEDLFGLAGIDISLPVTTTIGITPDGVASVRTVTVGGDTIKGPDPLTFHGPSPSVLSDPIPISCAVPAGNDLMYDLASTESNPTLVATTDISLSLSVQIIITVGTTIHIATVGPGSPVMMTLTAPTTMTDLGPVLANNVPPDLSGVTFPSSGDEGSPVQFDASATTSICGTAGLVYLWNFSDYGVEYGVSPQHTFQGPGTYSGQLTVTDPNGNSSIRQFAITITNEAPAVSAGPGTTAAWGRQVAFNGSATDPGADDQSTLSYSWDFGDGSPSATGGPSVMHAYATPATYHATFTACDQWGACNSGTRDVIVVARNVSLGYLGSTSGTYDTSASFSASLVDEFGQKVNGRNVTIMVGAENEGSPATNSSGVASASNVTELPAGPYTASASFAGDTMYNAAAPVTSPFTVSEKATTTTYTGALTGGPNKTIVLSAKLVDATNKPLGGQTISFQLGTQPASAVTDSSGVASVSLKLKQKNGTYSLTATFAGVSSYYSGSAASATFKLQSK